MRIGGGRRIERTLPPGATKADAQRLEATLRLRQAELASGRQPRRLIDEAIAQWEPEAQLLRSYQKDLRYRIGLVREFTAGRYLEEIPAVAAEIKAAGSRHKLKPASINRLLAILRRVANLAEQWGWTEQRIAKRVGMLPGERARHVYLTPEQVRALVAAAGDEAGDALILLALTGLRRGELLRLQPANIVNGAIVLGTDTKSGLPRTVPLTPQGLAIVQHRLPWKLTVTGLRKAFEKARIDTGMPHVRLHDLRHTFASWVLQGGASLGVVRDLLGHSSLAVTSRYAHLRYQDLEDATAKLRV